MIIDRESVAAALPNIEIGGRLGSGAFGLVLEGRHRRLNRDLAIKVLAAGPEGRPRFEAEAQVLAGLDHPHIVRVHDYVETDDLCLIVMEMLAGGTLTRRIPDLSPEAACAVGLGVASALGYAHERGVLHRDIKPDNVMFDAADAVKVTDFGIAKIFQGSGTTATTQLGTPMYMAPEQILGARIGPATDLYAVGVMLYRLLAGRAPFDSSLPLPALWRQVLNDPPPVPAGVPAPVTSVLLRALAKEPAERQASAAAFARDLAVAARSAYGVGWLASAGLPLRLDDDVREAATGGGHERPTVVTPGARVQGTPTSPVAPATPAPAGRPQGATSGGTWPAGPQGPPPVVPPGGTWPAPTAPSGTPPSWTPLPNTPPPRTPPPAVPSVPTWAPTAAAPYQPAAARGAGPPPGPAGRGSTPAGGGRQTAWPDARGWAAARRPAAPRAFGG
ncbi:serine/threonine-protein kinase, partial [Frankia nepalensis]|uniref:serine/threonine-protein kinase n=1 Tax=Frankia nepalensis TaxID=1836974 RepID=UPI001EE3DA28